MLGPLTLFVLSNGGPETDPIRGVSTKIFILSIFYDNLKEKITAMNLMVVSTCSSTNRRNTNKDVFSLTRIF